VWLFEDSPALRLALAALPGEAQTGLQVSRHPWIGQPRMLCVFARSYATERAVEELTRRFALCVWRQGRWHVRRVQLSLFG
jgi:hypothetical protein